MWLHEYWTEKGEFSKEKAEMFADLVVEKFRVRGEEAHFYKFSDEGFHWLRNFLIMGTCFLCLEHTNGGQNKFCLARLFVCTIEQSDGEFIYRDTFSVLLEDFKEKQKENDLVLELVRLYENSKNEIITYPELKTICLIEILEEMELELAGWI